MTQKEIFEKVMQNISLFLNQKGYSQFTTPKILPPSEYRLATTFRKPCEKKKNYGVIDFQRKTDGSSFTINFGVSSGIINLFSKELHEVSVVPGKPKLVDCAIRNRINRENLYLRQWWPIIPGKTAVEDMTKDIQDCLEQEAILTIEKLMTDEQLKHYYSSCKRSGIPQDIQILEPLAILLKASNDIERLDPVMHELETRFAGHPVNETARKLVHMLRTKSAEDFQVSPHSSEIAKATSQQETRELNPESIAIQPKSIRKRRAEVIEDEEDEAAATKKRNLGP